MAGKQDKILESFYEYPRERFTIRKIAKVTKIPKSTVQEYVKSLKKNKLITEENQSSNSLLFKTKKTNYFIEKIILSGLINYIVEKLNPSCVILFGSFRKGESEKDSDIDLFIESSMEKNLVLAKFEKILKHKVDLHIKKDIHNLPNELLNNVVNGIKIYGSFTVK